LAYARDNPVRLIEEKKMVRMGQTKANASRVFSQALAMYYSFYFVQQMNYTQNKVKVKDFSSEFRWNPLLGQ